MEPTDFRAQLRELAMTIDEQEGIRTETASEPLPPAELDKFLKVYSQCKAYEMLKGLITSIDGILGTPSTVSKEEEMERMQVRRGLELIEEHYPQVRRLYLEKQNKSKT